MEGIVNYSYRGRLKSCNYNCGYCPFSKTSSSSATLQSDREDLIRFCDYIETCNAAANSLQIFLIPYGEGMIHPHYAEALARLSRLSTVRRVSCQTNLSWNIDHFADYIRASGGNLPRISFWCSFHPQCTQLDSFISQCNKLEQYGIRHCVGMVAKPGYESLALEMRKALPPRTYMWLNSMDGLKRPYTPKERAIFNTIDPFFNLNQQGLPPNESTCLGGKNSLYVQADGRTALCPIAGKYTGNIYKNSLSLKSGLCKASRCNCYLAYSNRLESNLETFFGPGAFLRIPERIEIKNLFLDIDGTLIQANNRLQPGAEKALMTLATTTNLYFATELPFLYAQKKCSKLFPLFTGGIFAGGAHIRLFNPEMNYYFYILPEFITQVEAILTKYSIPKQAIKKYSTSAGIYRIAITGNQSKELFYQLTDIDGIHLQRENGLLTIISNATDKGKALVYLLKHHGDPTAIASLNPAHFPDSTLAIGNDISDIAMFPEVKYPLSVPGSNETVRQASLLTLPIALLPIFFGL